MSEDFIALQDMVKDPAETQPRTEQRVGRIEIAMVELANAQRRTEDSLNKLAQSVDRFDSLIGDNLERKYRERAFAYLGQILRPVHSVSLQDVLPDIEDRLTESEVDELLPLDVLLRGRVRQVESKPEVWIALEVSATVDRGDVERAVRRAELLAKTGLLAMPAVAGEAITEGASDLASRHQALVLQDGRRVNWPQAIEAVLAQSPASPQAAA